MLKTARCKPLHCRRTIARRAKSALLVLFSILGACSTDGGQTGDEGKHSGGDLPAPGGSAGSTSGGSAGSTSGAESAGGATSGAGGVTGMGGESESAGSSNGGAGGAAGMCVNPGGDLKTCVLDHQNKQDAATACTPGAPDQCQDTIMNDCGCQVAVNDAESAEVACYLAALAERSCSLCTPGPCVPPLGQCELSDRPTPTCR